MRLELDAEASVDAAFELEGVEAVEHLGGFHGRRPGAVLDAVDGRLVEVLGDDAPLLAVGLDAAGDSGPSGSARFVVRDRSEEVDEVLGLRGDGLHAEGFPPAGDLAGELVAVGEGVAVLCEPCVTLLGGLLELLLSFVEFGGAGAGHHAQVA